MTTASRATVGHRWTGNLPWFTALKASRYGAVHIEQTLKRPMPNWMLRPQYTGFGPFAMLIFLSKEFSSHDNHGRYFVLVWGQRNRCFYALCFMQILMSILCQLRKIIVTTDQIDWNFHVNAWCNLRRKKIPAIYFFASWSFVFPYTWKD